MTRPLVLLHGFTGSPASWDIVVAHLPKAPTSDSAAGHFSVAAASAAVVLAPAALGHDGTAGPDGIDSFGDEVDRLATVIRKGLDRDTRGTPRAPAPAIAPVPSTGRPHLAGYSMGGRLALSLLVRHGELFASATLIGASPGLRDPAEREARTAWDEKWARLLDEEGLDTFVAAWEALPLFASQETLPAERLERQAAIRRGHDPRGLARSLRTVGLARMPDYRRDLAGIGIPVRLVVGDRDAKFRNLAEEMADRLPRATVTFVPDAGHNVVLERPREIAGMLQEDRGP